MGGLWGLACLAWLPLGFHIFPLLEMSSRLQEMEKEKPQVQEGFSLRTPESLTHGCVIHSLLALGWPDLNRDPVVLEQRVQNDQGL